MKRLFEAEVNLMIHIGFDLEVHIGSEWLLKWKKAINDQHFFEETSKQLCSLYYTTVVIYFEPELLALTALKMTI